MQLNDHLRNVIECIRAGTQGQALNEIFFPSGLPVPKECALWDYKGSFECDNFAYAELAKDALSFFNSYGGYIFLGVAEIEKDQTFEVVGFARPADFLVKIRGSLERYCSCPIEVHVHDLDVAGYRLTVIYVPQRAPSQQPAFLTRNGPERSGGRALFNEKSTFFRQGDRSLVATVASQWEFLNSNRNPDLLLGSDVMFSVTGPVTRVILNNLPDRNLICPQLYGREDFLANLWAWIASDLDPVRLLAGAGGKGKTSIAFEFASRFFRHAPLPFEQVLWVSAKRQQFRPDKNEYIELPECWYSNPIQLLEALCVGTAALVQHDGDEPQESEYTLQKKLKESLRLLPSLVIVDDIDSLPPGEQRRVFELVQHVSAGTESKFLLTTRANFAFSEAQCIQVMGLDGDSYQSFVLDRLGRFGLKTLKSSDITKLQKASAGSPLWTESILRLMKQGRTFGQALGDWEDKPGEDARAAALKKELQALSPSARKLLFVASLLRDSSRAELLEITKLGRAEFDGCITELQTLFLVDAPTIIKDEPRFSVPDSTAIAVKEAAEELVVNHRGLMAAVRDFTKRAHAGAGVGPQRTTGIVVNQAMALLTRGETDAAIKTVEAALVTRSDNPDLLMLKGRCLLQRDRPEAIRAFDASFKKGQRRPLLFDLWYQSANDQGQFGNAVDVSTLALETGLDNVVWLPLRARAYVQIAMMRHREGNLESAVELLKKSASDVTSAIRVSRSSQKEVELKTDLFAVNDAAWKLASGSTRNNVPLLAFDAIKSAVEGGDYRIVNVDRLLMATAKLIEGLDLSSDSAASRAGRTRVADAMAVLRSARSSPEVPASAHNVFDNALAKLTAWREA